MSEADCLVLKMDNGNGKVNGLKCSQQLNCAVCQRMPDLPEDLSDIMCEAGFTFHGG